MNPDKIAQFKHQVESAVASEQLYLPSFPDIALQVRQACEQEDTSAQQLAEILGQDAALTVRLMQVANSALYRSRSPADNLQTAITRLGLRLVRQLVMTLAMKQVYQTSNSVLDEGFRELWLASTKTASLCRMLASDQPHLDNENALLAGLIHNIGALPVLVMAENDPELLNDARALNEIIRALQGKVGAYIFQNWHFPDYMQDIALLCYDFDRAHSGDADYLDVVQVALVEASIYTGLEVPDDWDQVPAFSKLSVDTRNNILNIEENRVIFEETQLLFN